MATNNSLNIVFGTGPLGNVVSEELLARGQSVKLVNRSCVGNTPEETTFVKADFTDPN